jgi:adenylate cyclase
MRKKFFKERFFVFFFVCLSVFLLTILGCLFLLLKLEDQSIQDNNKYNSLYQLADECRQTSDDLSTMARLYVLTGSKKYEKYYHEIVDIRKGIAPFPKGYNEVYWDLVIANELVHSSSGEALSFMKRVDEEEMSEEKKGLLELSLQNSTLLGQVEEEAMNAKQGKFKNAAGQYILKADPNPRLARRLISDPEYIKRKAEIMKPLQEFYNQIDQEIADQMKVFAKNNRRVIFLSIILLIGLGISMFVFLRKSLISLTRATESNENLLLSALPPAISERLKHGDESSVKECEACVLFLDVGMESQNKGQESAVLQALYREIDQLVEKFKVERIRTLQGNYMVASGISGDTANYAENIADFALAAKEKIKKCSEENNLVLYIQAGVASGTVISGVLDHKKYIYDLWGDVLKVANTLETKGVKGEVQITKKLASQLKGSFEMVEKEGEEGVYFLRERIFEE